MPTTLIDQLAGDMLLHVAFLVVALAFLVRDVLWLRGLSVIAYSLFMAVAALTSPEAPWTLLAWYGGFIAINVAHAVWLICERQLCRLSAEERKLLELAFPALDKMTLKRLLRHGRWRTLPPDTCLTRAGSRPEEMYVLLDGRVDVQRQGRTVAAIGPGHFVAEMAFVTDGEASADTRTGTQVRAFAWNQETIVRACRRQPELREAIYSAIGPDLARKIARTSEQVSAANEPPEPAVAAGREPPVGAAAGEPAPAVVGAVGAVGADTGNLGRTG
jgi:CRP-like cAMP-binding protein